MLRRTAANSATIGLVVLGGTILLPSYAHDDGDGPATDTTYTERLDDDGNIIPEKPHAHEDLTVSDRAELRAFEQQVDPADSPDVFVCANPGDTEVTVVHEYPSRTEDLKPAARRGQIIPGADQCANKSMVVGK
jgi:hypothetical protein